MNNHKERLESIIRDGYEFNFSDYLSQGIELFKKDIGSFVGYMLVYLVIVIAASFVPFGSLFVTYPLYMGFALVAHQIARGQEYAFQDFFKGFQDFGPLLLTYLVMFLAILLVMSPMLIMFFSTFYTIVDVDYSGEIPAIFENGTFLLVFFLAMIPMIYLTTSWRWAPYLVVFYKLSFWDALETSRRLVGRNFWITLGFIILLGLLASAGVIALFVGMLFTIPMAMCMEYAAFADITRLEEEAEISGDIMDHFVE